VHKLPRTIRTLEKKTSTLRTLLTHGASEDKLLKAAERVQVARIQVLQAKIGTMPSVLLTLPQHKRIAKIGGKIEALRAATPVEILAEFRLAQPPEFQDS
jgi:hypothetical protein